MERMRLCPKQACNKLLSPRKSCHLCTKVTRESSTSITVEFFIGFCFLTLSRSFFRSRRGNGSPTRNGRINIDCSGERVTSVVAGGLEFGLLQIPYETLGRVRLI